MNFWKPNPDAAVTRDRPRGFTLVEMLVVLGVIGVLSAISFSGWRMFRGLATGAVCTDSLRQLSAAVNLYASDHGGFFPPYVRNAGQGARQWFFGFESTPPGTAEGARSLDRTQGPLYPYIETVGKIEVCPGFNYGSALWKPKFKGASYGYGYNWILGGRLSGTSLNLAMLRNAARVILFGDCGQVNTFQPPASPKRPMIEEFYLINETDKTIHFRHNGRANLVFVDGHVESMKPYPGTTVTKVRGEITGRVTKAGSMELLR